MSKYIVDIKGELEGDYEILGEYKERPQGEWERVRVDKTHYNYVCSECGYKAEFRKGNYCPNCGVQMIKEVKND